jgi:hypothetical protein
VLAAGGVGPDGAGLHAGGAVESGFDPVPACLFKHLVSGVTDRDCPEVKFFWLFGDDFFLYHVVLPPFVESIGVLPVAALVPWRFNTNGSSWGKCDPPSGNPKKLK